LLQLTTVDSPQSGFPQIEQFLKVTGFCGDGRAVIQNVTPIAGKRLVYEERCPQPKIMPERCIYLLFGVLSIACLVSFLFLGVTSGKRKASDSSQPDLPFWRIPSKNQQLAALAKDRTHTFQPKASFSERKRQKDAKASLIASLPDSEHRGSSKRRVWFWPLVKFRDFERSFAIPSAL